MQGCDMATCFYCFADTKLTRAHLYQKRFREVIEGVSGDVFLTSSRSSHKGINRELAYRGDIRDAHVSSLCEECNRGWMEPIEQAAAGAFADVVTGRRIPPPADGLALARWAIVVGALSSELYPTFEVPESHRRDIRGAAALPSEYSTFIIWTEDRLVSLQTDLYRGVSAPEEGGEVHWVSVIQTGLGVLVSATPGVTPRLARVLHEAGISAALGFIGENLVYVPDGVAATTVADASRPTHKAVHDLIPSVLGKPRGSVAAANGVEVLDFRAGMQMTRVDMSFDFSDRVFDYGQLPTDRRP